MVGDGKKDNCPQASMNQKHGHTHSHFYSVVSAKTTSRRKVAPLLFWKYMLGPSFPVSDDMIKKTAIKFLDSCAFGFNPGNSQLKTKGQCCLQPLVKINN